jgi:hypothetical protein
MKSNENASPNEKDAETKSSSEVKDQTVNNKATKPKKKSAIQSVLMQVGWSLLFLVIGMLVILIALYFPTSSKLKSAQTELDRLVPMETEYLDLQKTYANAEAQVLVYKLMSNTSKLQEVLLKNDLNRTKQYLDYIEEDLNQLKLSEFPELPASFIAQFEKVKTSINSNSITAADDLEEFYNDMLRLADNL